MDLEKNWPDQTMSLELLLGPTGKLRASTLRKRRNLLVGFNETSSTQVLPGFLTTYRREAA